MFCRNCLKDIPVGEIYFKFNDFEETFCCKECATDYLFYKNMLSIETNTGEEEQEESE